MTFGSSISTCLGKYANFKGRAIRSEYWWFYLFFVIISIVSSVISGVMFEFGDPMSQGLPAIVNLAFTLPLLSAGARRLHDIGKSGWWQLILLTGVGAILLIIWWCSGTKSDGDKYNL